MICSTWTKSNFWKMSNSRHFQISGFTCKPRCISTPDLESSWDVAAAVTWKFRLTFRPGNHFWSLKIWFWLIWELSDFWDRGSTQNFEPDLSSRVIWPVEPVWENYRFSCYFPNWHDHGLGNQQTKTLLTFQKCSNGRICNFHLSKIQIINEVQKIIQIPHFYPLWGA